MTCSYNFNYYRWDRISKEAKKLVSSLLEFEPAKRSTIQKALESTWIVANEPSRRQSVPTGIRNCFDSFRKNVLIKNLALTIIAHKSTSDEISEIRKMFESFDTTNSGRITFEEFKAAFEKYHYSEGDLLAMFNSAVGF